MEEKISAIKPMAEMGCGTHQNISEKGCRKNSKEFLSRGMLEIKTHQNGQKCEKKSQADKKGK